MKTVYTLDKNDIKMLVAEKYDVNPKQVNVRCFMNTIGYGMDEHDEPTVEVEISIEGERQ